MTPGSCRGCTHTLVLTQNTPKATSVPNAAWTYHLTSTPHIQPALWKIVWSIVKESMEDFMREDSKGLVPACWLRALLSGATHV
jgi:hypothetical protein